MLNSDLNAFMLDQNAGINLYSLHSGLGGFHIRSEFLSNPPQRPELKAPGSFQPTNVNKIIRFKVKLTVLGIFVPFVCLSCDAKRRHGAAELLLPSNTNQQLLRPNFLLIISLLPPYMSLYLAFISVFVLLGWTGEGERVNGAFLLTETHFIKPHPAAAAAAAANTEPPVNRLQRSRFVKVTHWWVGSLRPCNRTDLYNDTIVQKHDGMFQGK